MWVLVHWIKSDQTSILTDDMVTDKKMLEDPKKVGMVKHGNPETRPPKHGWKAYIATVLAKSDKKSDLIKQEAKFIEELKQKNEGTGGPARTNDSSGSDDDGPNPKKKRNETQNRKKKAEKKTMEALIEESRYAFTSSNEESDVEDMTRQQLIQKVQKLKKQHKDLNDFYEDMKTHVSQTMMKAAQTISVTCNGAVKSSVANAPVIVLQDQDKISNIHVPDSNVPCAIQKYLSEGTLTHIKKSKDAGKLICNLMTAMFSNDEMEKCLVTGKRIKQEERERELLDQDKVSAIVEFALAFYPHMTTSAIRAKMAMKCKDQRHAKQRLIDREKLKNFSDF